MRVALLEDDKELAELLSLWLEEEGFGCSLFHAGEELIRTLGRDSFDLLIIDWLLPDTDGEQVLRWVREHVEWPVPVLFITRRDRKEDIVRALETGADDYMVKPVDRGEMVARVRALARRAAGSPAEPENIEAPPYSVDLAHRRLTLDGDVVELTQKEFELASFLFRHAGQVVSRSHILNSVWGHKGDLSTRTVDTHVSRLRNKLHLGQGNGWRLAAVYQHGYRLEQADGED